MVGVEGGGGRGKIPGRTGETLASQSKVKRTHPLQACTLPMETGRVFGIKKYLLELNSPVRGKALKDTSRMILLCFLEQWRKVKTSRGFIHSVVFMEKLKLK